MEHMITEKERISKFLAEHNMCFSSVHRRHIIEMLMSVTSKGFTGKTTEMAHYSSNHRSTVSHFLSKGKWDDGH